MCVCVCVCVRGACVCIIYIHLHRPSFSSGAREDKGACVPLARDRAEPPAKGGAGDLRIKQLVGCNCSIRWGLPLTLII